MAETENKTLSLRKDALEMVKDREINNLSAYISDLIEKDYQTYLLTIKKKSEKIDNTTQLLAEIENEEVEKTETEKTENQFFVDNISEIKQVIQEIKELQDEEEECEAAERKKELNGLWKEKYRALMTPFKSSVRKRVHALYLQMANVQEKIQQKIENTEAV